MCGVKSSELKTSFPYQTYFNNTKFTYLKCNDCSSVFVSPSPNKNTINKMYDKTHYHDLHYQDKSLIEYIKSADLLKKYLKSGATVLDYGCGVGAFLIALKQSGFTPIGVEYDEKTVLEVFKNTNFTVYSIDGFPKPSSNIKFDAIHLGDVLEHLPNPKIILEQLLQYLNPAGVLFVEGPLEINHSPVYWASCIAGRLKKLIKPNLISNHPPTHLFRVNGESQLTFLKSINPSCKLVYWQIYETGWPYANGGFIKNIISKFAKFIGGKTLFGKTFGNRFKAILINEHS